MRKQLLERIGETAVQLQEAETLVRNFKASGDKASRRRAELAEHMLRGYLSGLRYAFQMTS